MKETVKGLIFVSVYLLFTIGLFCENVSEKSTAALQKEIIAWVSPEGPPGVWIKGYGEEFPVEYMFKSLAEAGFTDIELQAHSGRGPDAFYHDTKVQFARKCPRMENREWLEEALTAADKHGLRIWLILTPDYKVKDTDIAGLNDPRHIRIWTDLVEEYGKNYKPRHKSLAGIYLHELDCAEAPDTHENDSEEFNSFCEKNFGEKYSGTKMPDGKSNTKWDKRFHLYKNNVMNNFVRIMKDTAAKYGMKTAFCLYSPEQFTSDSAAWGYDTPAIEKLVERMWVTVRSEYRDLKGSWVDTGPSYRGANIPYRETMAFHGKAIGVWESRSMMFPDVVRKAYRQNKEFTKVHGDVLNGYMQKSEKVIDLFTRPENVKKWNSLQKEWIGASSQARIALMSSCVPFVLRFPSAPGVEYKKVFTSLLDSLKKYYPADVQLTGSEFTLNPENLSKYDLIIIPEEMGIGMDEAFLKSLQVYLAKGGKLLALGTPLTTGSSDLEQQKDHMEEIFGIKIKNNKTIPGYVALKSEKLPVPEKKIWADCRELELTTAEEVLISNKFTGKPIMTKKGNAYYLAFGYTESADKFFVDFIDKISPQPARLHENSGFRFSSIIKNNNMLCVALPCEKATSAILSIDIAGEDLKGDKFDVKNIITGKNLYSINAEELKKGIEIKTDYDSEPYVLAIGTGKDLAQFKGIYSDNKVFADMGKINIVENPEVAIAIPDKTGIKVGIYQNAYGAEKIYSQLSRMPEFNCFYLPRLDGECMNHADVIIIPQPKAPVFFNNALNEIKEMTRKGKGLILTHDAAAKAKEIFPDIVSENKGKIMNIKDNGIKITTKHPSLETLKQGDEYMPGFAFDHYAFTPGKNAQTIAKDIKGNDVIMAGNFEKGRVMIYGTLPGAFCAWNDPSFLLNDKKLEGRELQLLSDSVKWLAGDKK